MNKRLDSQPSDIDVDVRLKPDELHSALVEDVRKGFSTSPRQLPPVWFYDERGSNLFDQITRLPEYYPTNSERRILAANADEIAAITKADVLIELGSGTSEKTRLLLDAMSSTNRLSTFAPLDVSEEILRNSAEAIALAYPGVSVRAVVGDFHHHLDALPRGGRRLVAFLGGTIGNLTPEERSRFLFDLDCQLEVGDSLLLGTDLVKDSKRLIAAYNDSQGVTAEFNLNLLHVLNRELGANFVVENFEHRAIWNEEESWIEMRLRSRTHQRVTIPACDLEVEFAKGEELLTEISAKFTPQQVTEELAAAGLQLTASWSDPEENFLLTLSTPYC